MSADLAIQTEDEVSPEEPAVGGDAEQARQSIQSSSGSWSQLRLALAVLVPAVAVLGGLAGWYGYDMIREHKTLQEHQMLLQAGRQTAVNLTTIDSANVDADIQRILDSATGTFHDEFQSNAGPFANAIRISQSKTVGSVTEAGIESIDGDTAQILVTAAVKTSNAATAEQKPRLWRMRITVDRSRDGSGAKVSNVGFVP
ncbi:hypothetical protein BA059_22730 [Mycolicibacterium sp. (ex Dasyatis americana)]|nr:hypothetical protein BA059_22730 [Mycolicibacterium sp. (ex Dasyatis americana)]